jgi:hypothetical protein
MWRGLPLPITLRGNVDLSQIKDVGRSGLFCERYVIEMIDILCLGPRFFATVLTSLDHAAQPR